MAKHDIEEEPSIEEILDSIRQIISDDTDDDVAPEPTPEPAPVKPAPAPVARPEPTPEPEEEHFPDEPFEDVVIELTEKVEAADIDSPPAPSPAKPAAPAPVARPEPAAIPEPDFEINTFESAKDDNPEVAMAGQSNDSLLTRTAESAAFEGFMELAKKTAVEKNGITLEEIVRTELNPLLREWLDKNLPTIIERLVREELERVSKRVLED